ncbi:hypothetical protein SUGI_1229210 [Cryptomeria japonica]|uniref:Uncharacterized protein n=1 Tax=Cryptomeria japonica TaxID=3369 RepID=A0AAD3RPW2_CRYJA|nr:hypothetical protein SUGI_1229210 [Cryptomeria japonica]
MVHGELKVKCSNNPLLLKTTSSAYQESVNCRQQILYRTQDISRSAPPTQHHSTTARTAGTKCTTKSSTRACYVQMIRGNGPLYPPGPVFFVGYIRHISEDRYSTRSGGFVEKGRFNLTEPPDIGIAKGTIHFFIDLSPMTTRNKQIRNSTSRA